MEIFKDISIPGPSDRPYSSLLYGSPSETSIATLTMSIDPGAMDRTVLDESRLGYRNSNCIVRGKGSRLGMDDEASVGFASEQAQQPPHSADGSGQPVPVRTFRVASRWE